MRMATWPFFPNSIHCSQASRALVHLSRVNWHKWGRWTWLLLSNLCIDYCVLIRTCTLECSTTCYWIPHILTRLHMSCVVQFSSTPSSFQCLSKLGKYISKISVATDQTPGFCVPCVYRRYSSRSWAWDRGSGALHLLQYTCKHGHCFCCH